MTAAPAAPSPSAQAPSAARAKPAEVHPDYGINKAIELMRMLPNDNIELVVRVVKTTLESTNIKVATIVKDASQKLAGIEARVDVVKKEIAGLEAQIATRRGEISALEADHRETATVKERLALAEKLSAGGADVAEQRPAGAAPSPRPATPSTAPEVPGARQEPPR
jgi:peptidoglycan hydrolase CwlO-like protein